MSHYLTEQFRQETGMDYRGDHDEYMNWLQKKERVIKFKKRSDQRRRPRK
jgi:hypothetical protein